jgi:phosphoribosylformylglycinamidine cyclo-ligase
MDESRYRTAGVDIDAAVDAVERMKPAIRATYTPSVLADVGSFGGLYALEDLSERPVLVASIDGVGTKVKLAAELGRWRGIGFDIVNHCVNDILVQNARPLFFLDYVAASKLAPQQVAEVVIGIAAACRESGCALIGGETAEMPGVYIEGVFDVVGAVVGLVDRAAILPDTVSMQGGDALLGLPSSGPHTNGYTLIRQAIADKDLGQVLTDGRTLGDALLEPHRAYVREITALQEAGVPLLGMAHITGGGLVDNLPRVLPAHLCAAIDAESWERPEIFRLLMQWTEMAEAEAFRVFNLGIGMVLVVPQEAEHEVRDLLPETVRIGQLTERDADGAAVKFI